ncbi:MAG: hypothetical protein L3J57_14605 [Desulfuromusa sp.]|nr:hypothetical protein [Desulfuromusa sp.]
MIERIIYSWSPETTTLMGISIVFGALVGMIVVIALILLMQKSPADKEKFMPRRLLSPRRHRKQSEKRATDIALARVAGLAIEGPTRR